MIKVFTDEQMREADGYTIKTLKVPSLSLMENAGKGIAEVVEKYLTANNKTSVLVVCGGGNNGGDGFVCARYLKDNWFKVDVLCLAEKLSPDCLAMKEKWSGTVLKSYPEKAYDVIVDCLFGTGLSRPIEGENAELIKRINSASSYVVSADIPSGLSGKNGLAMGACVIADETVTVGEYKCGLYLNDGFDVAGKITRIDVGIDSSTIKDVVTMPENSDVIKTFKKRLRNTHKGTYGEVCIIAGSKKYSGAALLSLSSALRMGAGYTRLCVPEGMYSVYAGKYPEAILTAFKGKDSFEFDKEDLSGVLKASAIVIGMGCGVSADLYKMICYLLANYTGKLIIDADGINTLSTYGEEVLDAKKCSVLLTPHVKEFSKLFGHTVDEVKENGLVLAHDFALANRVTLLLKSSTSILSNGETTTLLTRGNASLAKGGSGDVLSGMIGALAAQGNDLYSSAMSASYVMGISAELCSAEMSEYSVLASDVVRALPKAILFLGK